MSAIGNLLINITGNIAGLQKSLGQATGLIENLGKTAVLGAGVAVAGGAAAIAGFAAESVSAFIPFQKQMNEVFTLLPGISQGAMEEMTSQVLDFSAKFGTLPEEVVPALYQALSAGVPPDNVFTFLETAQKAATGGVSDLTTSIDGITSVVNAYGSDMIDATQASDLMFTAVVKGKTTFDELSNSLFNVIPTAASLGVQFGDVTAALASMTAQGVPTSVATTQLRQLLVELSKSGSGASKAFQEAAGVGFQQFIAQGHNLNDALGVMIQAADTSGKSLSDMFGSVEAGNAALALTGSGAATFAGNLAAMANSTGAANTAFTTMDSGISQSLAKAQALGQTFLLMTGQSLAPLIDKLVELGTQAMPFIQQVMTQAQPIFEAFAENLGSKLGPAATIIGDAISRIAVALGLTNEKTSASDLLLKLLKGTLDLIVTAVEATAVAFELMARTAEWLKKMLDPIPTPIEITAGALSNLLRPILAVKKAWDDLVGILSQPIDIPDWLKPGSPTPFEIGLRGINAAIKQLPDIGATFNAPGLTAVGAGGGGNTTTNIYIDGIQALTTGGGGGDPVDEALQSAFELLRQRLKSKR
jgi:TP901 family phage tail tape measure protein